MADGPHTFIESFRESLRLGEEEYWFISYIPWMLILFCCMPLFLMKTSGYDYKGDLTISDVSVVLSAFSVVGGILGAFTISSISQIQILVCKYPFSKYLKECDLFNQFIYIPQYIFLVQMSFVIICAISLIASIFYAPIRFELLIFCVGFLLYTSVKTWGLVDLIRLLSWHYGEFFIDHNENSDT